MYKIASVYRRPFALFYFPQPPKHFKPLKDFRRFQGEYILTEEEEYTLQKELLLFQQKREIALELYEQLETPIPTFSLSGSLKQKPEKLAEQIIGFLGIQHHELAAIKPGYDALNYWKQIFEEKGVLVFQSSGVPLHIMRGACVAEEQLPVVVVNSNDTVNGRIFSLFHELVHIVLREDGISNFRYQTKELYDKVEVFCNHTAAEVLVPGSLLLAHPSVQKHDSENPVWLDKELRELSTHFCVSQEVILRRLLSLNRTTNKYYQHFRQHQVFDKKHAEPGGNYYRNVIAKNGMLFINLALQGFHQEKLTASSLADFLKVKVSNLPELEKLLYAKVQY